MAKKKDRGNGDGDVYPRKNKDGKIIGYRGSYRVQTAEGPKRRYVSGKTKAETRAALTKARVDRDGGLVYGPDGLKVADYLRRTTFERYEQNCRKHIIPTLGRVKLKGLPPVGALNPRHAAQGTQTSSTRRPHSPQRHRSGQASTDPEGRDAPADA